MEQTVTPQIEAVNANPNPDAAALALPEGSLMDQLRHVAAEKGVALDANGNVVESQPEPQLKKHDPIKVIHEPLPKADPAPVEVPQKFQKEDGTVDEAKLDKSITSLEERIAYFKAKEREYQTEQNKVNNPPKAVYQAPPPAAGVTELEQRVAQDILADAQALGEKMTPNQALIQARSQIRLQEARLTAEVDSASRMTAEIRQELAEARMAQELEGLIKSDESLLDKNTADSVIAIRQANPKMSYREAYIHHLGVQDFQRRTGQVRTPTPTGQAAKAPPTPVGPVSRVNAAPVDLRNPQKMTDEQLIAEIRKQHPGFRNR